MEKDIKENKPDSLQFANLTELEIPTVFDKGFNKYLQKFMHSFRNKEHPTVNINNLLILNGTEHMGKSWFLRHNLKLFEDSPSLVKNLVIHYDIREVGGQSFNSFLFNFENIIITSIVQRNNEDKMKPVLTVDILKDILLYRYEKGWIEINISKGLKRSLDSHDDPYSYYIDSNKYNEEIFALLEQYERKAFKEYVLLENLDKIVSFIANSMGIDNVHACLLLFQDCLIQREDIHKNEKIFGDELYRDGIEVMEYLFDVVNHIGGYHEKQIEADSLRDVDSELPVYPHVVLALESVQCFFDMFDAEERPMNYLHRIMLRLYVNINNSRTIQATGTISLSSSKQIKTFTLIRLYMKNYTKINGPSQHCCTNRNHVVI
jgi:hypothetical protein